ncbi:uncharacterized protein PAC_18556 [Phialocephala subalpina]|uniref:N-acetyltransferase domain-containing protein n=1 Tax=Phialocephala subalpina TaxID=576137 RepID=A0A1L7XUK1_9HELO|nr:uncharacterized protein PAC_18556 [Phialocephala subalpina]
MAPSGPSPTFTTLFRSPHLTYRPLTSSTTDKSFLYRVLSTEPNTWAQSTNRLLQPLTQEDIDKHVDGLAGSLLAVIICLPPAVVINRKALAKKGKEVETSGKDGENRQDKDTPIGWLTLSLHPLSAHHRSATLGIIISEPYQRKGYGTESITWAIEWAFSVASMHSIRLTCFSFNDGALRLYRRMGFKEEGRNREAYRYAGRWWDRVLFSVLEDEWGVLKVRKELMRGEEWGGGGERARVD